MARIAIIGVGAVGGVIAAALSSRHELVLCTRRPTTRIEVQTERGPVAVRGTFLASPKEAAPVDWVLVTTKAYDCRSAAEWLPMLRANGTPVAILQNGVEHRERFTDAVPTQMLVPVMVDAPAERSAGGVTQRGPARLVVADDELGRKFVALFAETFVDASTTPDLKSALWRKLCVNAAGVVPALVDRGGNVLGERPAAALAASIIREVIAVGRAEGAILDDGIADAVIARYATSPSGSVNSLHADLRAKRPTEVDARNGVTVRLGRKHGLPTPYNEMAAHLVTLLEGRKAD